MIKHISAGALEPGVEAQVQDLLKRFPGDPIVITVLDKKQVNLNRATETIAKIQGVANLLVAGMLKGQAAKR